MLPARVVCVLSNADAVVIQHSGTRTTLASRIEGSLVRSEVILELSGFVLLLSQILLHF